MPALAEKNMTELFRQAFSNFPAVSSVEVRQRHEDYTINVTVTDFDRSVRNPIYDRQRELIKQFSGVSFSFYVIDDSPYSATDATFAERSS